MLAFTLTWDYKEQVNTKELFIIVRKFIESGRTPYQYMIDNHDCSYHMLIADRPDLSNYHAKSIYAKCTIDEKYYYNCETLKKSLPQDRSHLYKCAKSWQEKSDKNRDLSMLGVLNKYCCWGHYATCAIYEIKENESGADHSK